MYLGPVQVVDAVIAIALLTLIVHRRRRARHRKDTREIQGPPVELFCIDCGRTSVQSPILIIDPTELPQPSRLVDSLLMASFVAISAGAILPSIAGPVSTFFAYVSKRLQEMQ
jgi:hypothetical protein